MANIDIHKTILSITDYRTLFVAWGKPKDSTRQDPSLCSFLPAVKFLNVCSAGFPIHLSCSDTGVQSSTKLLSLHLYPHREPPKLVPSLGKLSALEGGSIVSVITLYNAVLLLLTFILTEGQLHPGLGLLIDQRQICQLSPALPNVMRCIDNYDTKCTVIVYRSFFGLTN